MSDCSINQEVKIVSEMLMKYQLLFDVSINPSHTIVSDKHLFKKRLYYCNHHHSYTTLTTPAAAAAAATTTTATS